MWHVARFTEALGKTFDPSLHEAALRRPGATTDEVLEELRWGRPVVVGFGRCGIFPRDFPLLENYHSTFNCEHFETLGCTGAL